VHPRLQSGACARPLNFTVRPMIDAYARWAAQLYPWRWYFAATTLGVFFALALVLLSPYRAAVDLLALIAGPLITISWGLLLLCVWFDPTRGKLQVGWFASRMPKPIVWLTRWYFAVFLALWFIFGVIAWPIFGLWAIRSSV
jgi:hypothetical protein